MNCRTENEPFECKGILLEALKTLFLLSMLPIFLSGCGLSKTHKPAANYYYLNPDKNLNTVGRTALIEIVNNSAFPQIGDDVTEALYQGLQKKQVFGLTVVRRTNPAWRNLQLDINDVYTLAQLSLMRMTLNCDAVLIGTITGFKPFPNLTIGLRLKLIDLKDGQLLWALEQIWDSTDKTTADRIEKYYSRHLLPGRETLHEQLGTVSSLKFLKFVAYETAETLQPDK